MEKIEMKDWPLILQEVSLQFEESFDTLSQMDAAMGDGDLGITMRKGFTALPGIFDSIEESDIGRRFFKCGVKLGSVIPSTMGTLMSSGFMEGGKKLIGKSNVDSSQFVSFLEGFAEGIEKRGKCHSGERTVLDAILPACQCAKEKNAETREIESVASAALEGAKKGVEETKSMLPRYGKAAVFTDKALGTADQGAVAFEVLLEGIYKGIKKIGESHNG